MAVKTMTGFIGFFFRPHRKTLVSGGGDPASIHIQNQRLSFAGSSA